MRQLQIKDGKAVSEWQGAGSGPIAPSTEWTFLDVTDRPEAQVGMLYDKETDTFSTPPPQRQAVISKLEFYQHFTPQERVEFRSGAKTDPNLADLEIMLQMATEVNLDSEATQQALGYMESIGIIAPGRAKEIRGA
jgi:hypothetical protein